MNRKTSSYKMTVAIPEGAENVVADALKAQCPALVDTTGVGPGEAFIRYRASSDAEAIEIGHNTTDAKFSLSIGYGVHRRSVDVG